ncbi:MAG: hypothetical protein R6W31_10180 [Bacteroidales bacterium]
MGIRKRILRRMGYLQDQQGILNRYFRESSHWRGHLDLTRAFIKSAFTAHTPGENNADSVAVLGSGWLLDVPLDDLLQSFKKVYLVDINHPPQIRKKVERLENVILLEEDLTGGAIEQVWRFTSEKGQGTVEDLIKALRLTPPLTSVAPSAYISVNLLNQLDIILCDYLSKHCPAETNVLDQFRTLIQSFHLQWVTQKPGCLITDTREISIHRDGTHEVKSLLFTSLPEGTRSEKWTWDFDTSGTYRSGIRSRMEVEAVIWS